MGPKAIRSMQGDICSISLSVNLCSSNSFLDEIEFFAFLLLFLSNLIDFIGDIIFFVRERFKEFILNVHKSVHKLLVVEVKYS